MKKLQLLLVSLLFISCGIKVTKHKTPEQVNKTIQLTTNKLDNFVKANEWMVNIFTNPGSIIQFTDKEAGVIKGKYIIHVSTVPSSQSLSLFYLVTVSLLSSHCLSSI